MENKGNHFLYKVYDTTVVHKLDSQRQKAFSEGVKVGKKIQVLTLMVTVTSW